MLGKARIAGRRETAAKLPIVICCSSGPEFRQEDNSTGTRAS